MEDKDRTKEQLIKELSRIRKKVDKLESVKLPNGIKKDSSDKKKAIEENEIRYRNLFNNLKCGIAVYEAIDNGNDFIFKDLNRTVEKIEKVKRKEIIGKSIKKVFPGVVEFGLLDVFKRVYNTGKSQKHPVTLYRDDRLIGWRENHVYSVFDGEIVAIYEDMGRDKQQEERLKHLNSVLNTIRSINQLIIKEKDKTKLIKKACSIFLKDRGYHSAWIVLVDEKKKPIETAETGVSKGLQTLVERIGKNKLSACWEKAMSSSSIIINKNPKKDCGDCPLSSDYSDRGAMTIKLECDNKIYGILSVSTSAGYIEDKEEQNLFAEVAGDISFALCSIEREKEQKEAARRLKESEHRFERLSKSAREGIIFHDRGEILDVNKVAADMAGVKNTDFIIGKSAYSFMQSDSRNKAIKMEKEGFEGIYELKLTNQDGKTIDVEAMGSPTYYNGRKVRVVVFRDITRRKKAEKELIESEAKYRSLYLAMDEGVCLHKIIYDKNKKPVNYIILDINDAYEKIIDLKRDQVINKKATEAYGTVDAPYIDIYEKVVGTGKSKKFEAYFAPFDKYFNISAFSYEKDKFATVFSDITESIKEGKKLSGSYKRLQKTINSIMDTLTRIIEIRDPYTSGHQKRVAALAIAISKDLDLDKDSIEALHTAAIIHDIGKINIPASILAKPGKLSDIEFEMIKTHPQLGCDMLKKIDFPWSINDIIIQHHERMDGSGYPNGLKNKSISLEARILAVADIMEAMSSHRPYRPALGTKKALEEIKTNSGILYDAEVVDICIRLFNKKKFKFD